MYRSSGPSSVTRLRGSFASHKSLSKSAVTQFTSSVSLPGLWITVFWLLVSWYLFTNFQLHGTCLVATSATKIDPPCHVVPV